MQISFAMLIFLLFSDQISGGQTASGGHPLWKKARFILAEISLLCITEFKSAATVTKGSNCCHNMHFQL